MKLKEAIDLSSEFTAVRENIEEALNRLKRSRSPAKKISIGTERLENDLSKILIRVKFIESKAQPPYK